MQEFGGLLSQRVGLEGQRDSDGRSPVQWVQCPLPCPESPWVPLRVRILHQGQMLREVHANITVEVKPSVPPCALAAPVPTMPRLSHGAVSPPAGPRLCRGAE